MIHWYLHLVLWGLHAKCSMTLRGGNFLISPSNLTLAPCTLPLVHRAVGINTLFCVMIFQNQYFMIAWLETYKMR